MKIMVVDDEKRIAKGLKKILTKINSSYDVTAFSDPLMAYDCSKEHEFDVVITDITCLIGRHYVY